MRRLVVFALVVVAAVGSVEASCTSDRPGAADLSGSSPGSAAGGSGAGVVNPGNASTSSLAPGVVASMLAAVELGEIRQAQVAAARSSSADVRALAARIVADDSASVARLLALPGIGTIGASEPRSARLARAQELVAQDLATAAPFDAAFLAAQIGANAEILGLIDAVLVPAALAAPPSDASAPDGGIQDASEEDAFGINVADTGPGGLDGDLVIQTLTSSPSSLLAELTAARGDALAHLSATLALQAKLVP